MAKPAANATELGVIQHRVFGPSQWTPNITKLVGSTSVCQTVTEDTNA